MGRNLTKEQWDQLGLRGMLLEKCFNVNEGFRRRDDIAPARVNAVMPETFDDGTPTVYAGNCTTYEDLVASIDGWYDLIGADKETGCPLTGKLQECGLDDVIPYMEKALAATGETMR